MPVSKQIIIDSVNEACRDRCFYFAVGLIKETLNLWKNKDNLGMLCNEGQEIATHYLGEV